MTYAVDRAAPAALIDQLRARGRVELFTGPEAVLARVTEVDDVPGVVLRGGAPTLVVEGDEAPAVHEAARAVLLAHSLAEAGRVPAAAVEPAEGGRSPLRPMLLALTLYAGVVLVGAALGAVIVDEKESGTIAALRATPMRLGEYLAAKLGLVAGVGLVLGPCAALVALGGDAPLGAVAVATLGVVPLAWLFGLTIGVAAASQLAAMSALKVMLLVMVSAPVLGFFDLGAWSGVLRPFGPQWGVQAMFAALTGASLWPALWAALTTLPLVGLCAALLARQLALGRAR